MKVWIATSGSYSDYRIEHVFLNEEDANAYTEACYDGGYASYEVHEGPIQKRPYYELTWWPHEPDQSEPRERANPWTHSYKGDYIPSEHPKPAKHEWHKPTGNNPEGFLRVEGFDHEAVLKVYSEQRAIYLAKREGLTD
jgi:hypothetical protein